MTSQLKATDRYEFILYLPFCSFIKIFESSRWHCQEIYYMIVS